ncbi:aminotransferase class IV [Thermodesulfovibrio sp. 3907-1M]|uniref:Aminotransferase class IV n=1 Tax=Thermodesulfovibrio autotrophicus TaxID=3118333 RepID=A0AAU8GY36_9BACT
MNYRTILFGEGLFETILWQGKTKKLLRHYERLKNSAQFFHIPCPDFESFYRLIEEKAEKRKNIYVKYCLISKGEGIYHSYPEESESLVIIKDYKADLNPKKLFISSIKRHSRNPVIYHKTMNYLTNILAKREALLEGFDDSIMLNENDEITECASSNILVVKGERLQTPAKESGLLSGTTLQILIEKANVKEERLKIEDLYTARAVFILNSLTGALPVSQIMDKKYPFDNEILQYLNSLIDEENQP